MASIRNVIAGLSILAKHSPERLDSHDISAEHDIILVSNRCRDLPADDVKTLKELDWFWSREYDCWAIFV